MNVKMLVTITLMLTMNSCIASLENAHTHSSQISSAIPNVSDTECVSLDNKKTLWAVIAAGSGVIGSAGGVSTLPITDQNWKIGIDVASISFAVFTAVAVSLSTQYSAQYVNKCTK